jgi:hypothetical protein
MPSITSAEIHTVPTSGRSAPPQGHALRLDIQGLRAVAVGLVVLSHAHPRASSCRTRSSGSADGTASRRWAAGFAAATPRRSWSRSPHSRRVARLTPRSAAFLVGRPGCGLGSVLGRDQSSSFACTAGSGQVDLLG